MFHSDNQLSVPTWERVECPNYLLLFIQKMSAASLQKTYGFCTKIDKLSITIDELILFKVS